MIDFEYRTPPDLAEAATILTEYGAEARVLAGGTALLLRMKRRLTNPRVLVDLRRVAGLAQVCEDGADLRIGASATLHDLETSPAVAARLPGLRQAVAGMATIRIRNQATIGGSVAHGDPLMDLPAILTALDASVCLSSSQGTRTIPLTGFYLDYLTTAARPHEIITHVNVPLLPPRSAAVHLRYLPRSVADYATIGVAVRLSLDTDGERAQEVRIVLTGAGATTLRSSDAESVLRSRRADAAAFADAAAAVRSSISPLSDSRGSSRYKCHIAEVFVRRALAQALEEARKRSL